LAAAGVDFAGAGEGDVALDAVADGDYCDLGRENVRIGIGRYRGEVRTKSSHFGRRPSAGGR
jgi:hypothetical protein